MSGPCTMCDHNVVCSLKKNFEVLTENILRIVMDEPSEAFSVEVKCKYFSQASRPNNIRSMDAPVRGDFDD